MSQQHLAVSRNTDLPLSSNIAHRISSWRELIPGSRFAHLETQQQRVSGHAN
jgi:hypothetical protein